MWMFREKGNHSPVQTILGWGIVVPVVPQGNQLRLPGIHDKSLQFRVPGWNALGQHHPYSTVRG